MTEAEWLTSENAKEMYDCLREQHGVNRRRSGKRKLKLFGCASCRLFGAALSDPRSLAAVEYMERFADGEADPAEMGAVLEQAREPLWAAQKPGTSHDDLPEDQAAEAAFMLVGDRPGIGAYVHRAMRSVSSDLFPEQHRIWLDQMRTLSDLFRDIFGNPFRPIAFDNRWRTSTAGALAKQMYDSRDFGAMPILADALEDAGCASGYLLNHCREPGWVHVRGCWVIDLVLGKG